MKKGKVKGSCANKVRKIAGRSYATGQRVCKAIKGK